MRRRLVELWVAAAALLLSCGNAWGALACSITASPSPFTGIYATAAALNLLGTFSVTCTRDPAVDPRRPDIWIGIDQGAGGRTMTRDAGGSTLTYGLYHKTYGQGLWTNSGNVGANQPGAGGVVAGLDFGNTGAVTNASFSVYLQAAAGQGSAPGVYQDTAVAVTLRSGSDTGALLNSAVLSVRISIQHDCRFSTLPAPISVNYTAFSAAAVPGSSSFAVTCTSGTPYTMALDVTRSVIPTVNLAYSLNLSGAGGTGTAVPQPYSVNVSIDAGQAGSCASAVCTGTDSRTITVTY